VEGSDTSREMWARQKKQNEIGEIKDAISSFETTGDELGEIPIEEELRDFAGHDNGREHLVEVAIEQLQQQSSGLSEKEAFLRTESGEEAIEELRKTWLKIGSEPLILNLDKLRQFMLDHPEIWEAPTEVDLFVGHLLHQKIQRVEMKRSSWVKTEADF
jgi:hypothetical protein